MTTWDLNRIRYAIRKVTGRYDQFQLPDTSDSTKPISITNPAGIDDYVNDFYLYDMPEHLRTLKLRDFYTFFTIPNCGTYSLPQSIYQIYDPIYIDNYQFAWYQYPDTFYRIWPELNFIDRNLFTPDGVTNTFNFFLSQTPVQQGTVVIGLNPNLDNFPNQAQSLETFTDQDQPIPLDLPAQQIFVNPGILTGNLGSTGKIDYLTGQVTITYLSPPPAGVNSSCHYHPYVASRPRDILFWQQQLFLRPIPNDTYSVKVMAYMMPTTVISSATNATVIPSIDPTTGDIQGFSNGTTSSNTNLPEFNEWWQLIVYGSALKIFAEDGDMDQYNVFRPLFDEQIMLAQRKTLKQLGSQRISTPYAENVAGPQFPIFPIY